MKKLPATKVELRMEVPNIVERRSEWEAFLAGLKERGYEPSVEGEPPPVLSATPRTALRGFELSDGPSDGRESAFPLRGFLGMPTRISRRRNLSRIACASWAAPSASAPGPFLPSSPESPRHLLRSTTVMRIPRPHRYTRMCSLPTRGPRRTIRWRPS
jgi:hypothetical protein